MSKELTEEEVCEMVAEALSSDNVYFDDDNDLIAEFEFKIKSSPKSNGTTINKNFQYVVGLSSLLNNSNNEYILEHYIEFFVPLPIGVVQAISAYYKSLLFKPKFEFRGNDADWIEIANDTLARYFEEEEEEDDE